MSTRLDEISAEIKDLERERELLEDPEERKLRKQWRLWLIGEHYAKEGLPESDLHALHKRLQSDEKRKQFASLFAPMILGADGWSLTSGKWKARELEDA